MLPVASDPRSALREPRRDHRFFFLFCALFGAVVATFAAFALWALPARASGAGQVTRDSILGWECRRAPGAERPTPVDGSRVRPNQVSTR